MGEAYYCEVCKTEVDWNAKSCPLCGVYFSGVFCPKCEKIGSSLEFADGCPKCGSSGEGSFFDKAADRTAAPKVSDKHEKKQTPWRPSLYWLLSILIILIVGFITSYWLRS